MNDWTRLVLDAPARENSERLLASLNRIETARDIFAIDLPDPWQAAIADTRGALVSVTYFQPDNDLEFRYLAIEYQGSDEKPQLEAAANLDRIGLNDAAAVMKDWCALARETPNAPLELAADGTLPPFPDDLKPKLQDLKARWIAATEAVSAQVFVDDLSRQLDISFLPEAEFSAHWLDRIMATDRYKALPDTPLMNQNAVRWRPQKSTLEALAAKGVIPSYQIWHENTPGQAEVCGYVATNAGILRVTGTVHHPDAFIHAWPAGHLVLKTNPPEKIQTQSPMDIPTRIEFNGLSRKLIAAREATRPGPLFETRQVLPNFRDVMRHQYLRGLLGVGDSDIFIPLANVICLLAVVAYGVLGIPHADRFARFLAGELSTVLAALTILTALVTIWLAIELAWRLPHAIAVLRGTIDRGRGRCPVDKSFGAGQFNRSNLVLRLMGFKG